MERLFALLTLLLLMPCLAFFLVGEAVFDTSGEYGLRDNAWFVTAQWFALAVPGLFLWLAMRLISWMSSRAMPWQAEQPAGDGLSGMIASTLAKRPHPNPSPEGKGLVRNGGHSA